MTSITYIGIDVHSTNYTLCAFSLEGQKAFGRTTINLTIDELLKYLATLQARIGGTNCKLVCGYEGVLGVHTVSPVDLSSV